jgi:hypothetical protein
LVESELGFELEFEEGMLMEDAEMTDATRGEVGKIDN